MTLTDELNKLVTAVIEQREAENFITAADLLYHYAALIEGKKMIDREIAAIENELKKSVDRYGAASAYGYCAKMKPGRKSTDHEAAALAAAVSQDVVDRFSTQKTLIQWAKITKHIGANTAPFTTQSPPVFVIEKE